MSVACREARLVAWAIDALVLLLALPLYLAFGGLTVLLQTNWLELDPSGREWMWGYVVAALWFAAPLWYFALSGAFGGSLGARVMGLRLITAAGVRPSPRQSLARALLLYPSVLVLAVGPLVALYRDDARPFHDRWTRMYLVERAS